MNSQSAPYQNLGLTADLLKTLSFKIAFFGALVAIVAIAVATAFSAIQQSGNLSPGALVTAQINTPALWILDLAPGFFALWGWLIGSRISRQVRTLIDDQLFELQMQTAALRIRSNHDSTHDAVTELPNRIMFNNSVDQLIRLSQRNKDSFGIIVLDLDRFKEINNTLGHSTGDRLLKLVGSRLETLLRKADTVARLGGDEFAILLSGVNDGEGIDTVSNKIQQVLSEPLVLDDLSLHIQASAGAVIFPDHGDDSDTLMQRADVALSIAKQNGKHCILYEETLDQHCTRRLTLSGELRQALDSFGLTLDYQPKILASTGRATSAEALIRWHHPKHGLLAPDEFINLAERTGLIKPLTHWVLKNAVEQGARWHDIGMTISLAVNLSAKNLLDLEFPETLSRLLATTTFPADSLILEITETAIMSDPDMALNILKRISDMGVHISIDDFGTGYSSLAYLKRLPVDEIKIDRSFVMDMLENSNDCTIVRTTIDLAHNLGLKVVAEGVEDSATMEKLRDFDCDIFQGYFFSKPLSAQNFEAWLTRSEWGLDSLNLEPATVIDFDTEKSLRRSA